MYRTVVTLGFILALTGCATPDRFEKAAVAGPYPPDDSARAAVQQHLKTTLKDYDSVKDFSMSSDRFVVTWFKGLIHGGGYGAGWLQCFQYNAKNSYGGYVGLQRDAVVIQQFGATAMVVNNVNWGMISDGCR